MYGKRSTEPCDRRRPALKVVLLLGAIASSVIAHDAAVAAVGANAAAGPFAAENLKPFYTPPFDRIKDSDYRPAIEAGMARQLRDVQRIANNPRAPTFLNTIVALERTGQLLARAQGVFTIASNANANPNLLAQKAALAPALAAHSDAILLNARLFARVDALFKERETLALDPESLRLLEVMHQDFIHAGAQLSPASKERLRRLNRELSTLSNEFSTRLLAATKNGAYSTANGEDLEGLSEDQLAAAHHAATERGLAGYVIPLQNTTQQPDLERLQVRKTRAALFAASWERAQHNDAQDTRALVARTAQARAQRAQLLGYQTFAAWKIDNQMAKTPAAALAFMASLTGPATQQIRRDAGALQRFIDTQPYAAPLEPWDWQFYAAQLRKAQFDLSETDVKPYFELNAVLQDGVFYAAKQLYGITFHERHDIPVYHPDVRVFEVRDADDKPLAVFYCDYFKRDNKNGGAWMSTFLSASTLLGDRPVVYNVANLPKPAPGAPALLSFEDVTTMFHEFGHALHGMFANTRYPSLSGTATARDFVEFPSQLNEHWATDPAVFSHFARHYQTGAPMPVEMQEKIMRSETFGRSYTLMETLTAAQLDLQWHLLDADAPLQDPDLFEQQALERTHTAIAFVPPRYRSSYFRHIWGGDGYSAGYYAYLWTQMLADDAFAWFDEHGGLTRQNGDRFRYMLLSRGNTVELGSLYQNWRGRPPTIEAMQRYRGLSDAP